MKKSHAEIVSAVNNANQARSPERAVAEKIQALTGRDLVFINFAAMQYVNSGLCQTRLEALEYMLAQEEK